jgi:hypothetical protein
MRLILDTKSPYCNLNESKSTINVNLPIPLEVNAIALISAEIPYVFSQLQENSTISINGTIHTLPVGNYNFYNLQTFFQNFIDSTIGTNIVIIEFNKTTLKYTIKLNDTNYSNLVKIIFNKNSYKLFGFLCDIEYIISKPLPPPAAPIPANLNFYSNQSVFYPITLNDTNNKFIVQTEVCVLEERSYSDVYDVVSAIQSQLVANNKNLITVSVIPGNNIDFKIIEHTDEIPKDLIAINLMSFGTKFNFNPNYTTLINYTTPSPIQPIVYQSIDSVNPAVLNHISCIYLSTNVGSQNVIINGSFKQIIGRIPINDSNIGSQINYETYNDTPYNINQLVSNIQVKLVDNNFNELLINADWSVELNLLF